MPVIPRALPFLLLTFLQEAVVILATSTIEGFFLKRVGSAFLPGAYLFASIASAAASLAYAAVRSRWSNRRLALATGAGFVLLTLALAGSLEASRWPAFYVSFAAVAIFVMLARIQLWLSINKRFTTREAKRVFPMLTGSGLAGSILGGVLLQFFPPEWGPVDYNRVTAAVAIVYLAVFWLGARSQGSSQKPQSPSPAGDWTQVLAQMKSAAASPYVRGIGLLVMSHMLVLTIVDYQFNRVCDARFPEETALIGFLGMFRSVTNMAAFVSQMVLTHRVVTGLGVGATLLVPPLAAFGYSLGLLLFFGFYAGVTAKLLGRFLQRTLFSSVYQVLFTAIDESRRDAAMLVCEGMAYSIGTIAASALLWSIVGLGPLAIDLACLAGAAVFLLVALRLRREYLGVLVEHFKSGMTPTQSVLSRLPGSAAVEVRKGSIAALARLGTRAIVPYLLEGLSDPHRDVRIEAIRGLASLGDETVLPELVTRLDREQDDRVRSQLLRAFARFKGSRAVEGLIGFLQDKVPRIRADLVEVLGTMDDERYARIIVPALEDREVRVRGNAILALWRLGDDEQVRRALQALRKLLESREPGHRATAAYVLGRIGNRVSTVLLLDLLQREIDNRVLRNVVVALSRSGGEGLVDPLLVAFGRVGPEVRPVWVAALKRIGRADAGPYVRAALTGEDQVRILAIEMLGFVPAEQALDTLLDLTKDRDPDIRISALRSATRFSSQRVEARVREMVRFDLNERVRATALRRLSGHQARRLVPDMLRSLEKGSDRERANTLESLTGLLPRLEPKDRDRFVQAAAAFLESPVGRVAANAAYALWKLEDPRGAEALRRMLEDDRVRSALHVIGKTGDGEFIEPVSKLLTSADDVVRTRATLVLERIGAQWKQILQSLPGSSERDVAELLSALAGGGPRVQAYLRRALTEGREALAEGLTDPDPAVRVRVLEALQLLGEPLGRPQALDLLTLPNEEHRLEAARMLAREKWKEPPEAFRRFWAAELDRLYRYVWSASLLRRIATVGMPSLLELAQAAAARTRRVAASLVATFDVFDPAKNLGAVAAKMDDSDPVTRARALEAIESLVPKELARHVVPVLESEERLWGELARKYWAESPGSGPGFDALFGLVRDADEAVRDAAAGALTDLAERYLLEMIAHDKDGRQTERMRALAETIERSRPVAKGETAPPAKGEAA